MYLLEWRRSFQLCQFIYSVLLFPFLGCLVEVSDAYANSNIYMFAHVLLMPLT